MATIITMPRLSDTMTDGTVATWLKKVGDKINEGDILAEIETDKATMEFESFNSGTLLHIGIAAGESAPVDALLAIIGNDGEDISGFLKDGASVKEESNTQEVKSNATPNQKIEAAPHNVPSTTEEKPEGTSSQSTPLPKGIVVVTMPRLSDTMTDGTVATWLKKVGDKVAEGDILAEIETDKATMEFESFNSGTLLFVGLQQGETAPVDSVLAIIGPEGTDIAGIAENYKKDGSLAAKPSTENKASENKTDDSKEEQTVDFESNGNRIFISPLAKKIADEKGINISQVKGSGENGRIVKSDIENFKPQVRSASAEKPTTNAETSEQSKQTVSAPVRPFVPAGELSSEEHTNSQMRKTIARRLGESIFTAPHYYLTIEVSMDDAIKSRAVINSIPETKVSFNDMVIKACAMALRKHPQVNSQWKENVTVLHHHVSIGVAVSVEDGLLVPVLPFTDQMSLTQIGSTVKDLAGKARTKKLPPNEIEGSTFTVSNLGMFGISEFTSIINQPNSAILSVGAIVEKPVVKNGQIVVGNTMKVTLACDHRTVDGATGAQFLQTLRQYLENPVTMLA